MLDGYWEGVKGFGLGCMMMLYYKYGQINRRYCKNSSGK
jgi:hypothetical protein